MDILELILISHVELFSGAKVLGSYSSLPRESRSHSWHGHGGTLTLRGELRTSDLKLAGCHGLQP